MKTGILTLLLTIGSFGFIFSNTPTTTLEPTCFIAPTIINVECDDNGTPYDGTDDTILSFEIDVQGDNDDILASNTFSDSEGNVDIPYGTTLIYNGTFSPSHTVTFTDTNDALCTAMVIITCPVAQCLITPNAPTDIVCDDNGTPYDESDDTFTFNIVVNGENTEDTASDTFNDDEGNSGIAYGTEVAYGPFPISGGTVMVTFTDADAPAEVGCTAVMMAIPPDPCSPARCEITPEAPTDIVCDDNGTPFDESDDTFTFNITVGGSNTEVSATNTFNDDQGNSGVAYGTEVAYGPYPISGGTVMVNYTDADAPDEVACTAVMMAIPPDTCSPATCEITPEAATDIACDDNGTPYDDSDDTFTFNILVGGENTDPAATNTFNDDQGNSGIAYGSTVNYGTYPISGGAITVTFTDADAPDEEACMATMMAAAPETCSPATCEIMDPDVADSVCDNNGTPFDASDDTYTFDVTINGENTEALATNTFNDDMGNSGIAYGSTINYGPFPISGGPIVVTYTDADAPAEVACTATAMGTPTDPCSTAECFITPDPPTDVVCDDNGTPFDESDDTFTFSVTVGGDNTDPAASDTFNDDMGNSGIAYGSTINYGPFPISGGPVEITYTDVDAPGSENCTATMMGIPPDPCSPATCDIIPESAADIVCDDNDTPFDESDDTFTFSVTVGGDNTDPTASDTFNDDMGNSGTYGSTINYGPFPISGGSVEITYTDIDAPTSEACIATTTVTPPVTCSPAMCEVIPEPAADIACDNNGTPFDDSDDTFTFSITVGGDNTDPAASDTFNDDMGNSDIAYGSTINYGPFPISGGPVVVTYTDVDAPTEEACMEMMMAVPPATCSPETCEIIPDPAMEIVCDDNGTLFDDSDDTFTFSITVNGDNTDPTASDTFDDDQGNLGIAYGSTINYGPFPISGGPIIVTYTDADAPTEVACTEMMMAVPPPTCSEDCEITPELVDVTCDDNGTPDDRTDDTFTFSVLVNGQNTITGANNTFDDDQFNLGVAYGTTLDYGPFPISGGSVTVNYEDTYTLECIASVTASPPPPCSLDAEVPTVGEWGLIILGLLMSITAVVGIRQRREEEVYG